MTHRDFTLRTAPTALSGERHFRNGSLTVMWEMDGGDRTECSPPGKRGWWPGLVVAGGRQRNGGERLKQSQSARERKTLAGWPHRCPSRLPSPEPPNSRAWRSQGWPQTQFLSQRLKWKSAFAFLIKEMSVAGASPAPAWHTTGRLDLWQPSCENEATHVG